MVVTRFFFLRLPLAIVCMALVFVVAAQASASGIEKFEHAIDHHHAPNPLVGTAHYDDAALGPGDAVFDTDPHRSGEGLYHHHHHHYADVSADLVAAQAVVETVVFTTARLTGPRRSPGRPGGIRQGPDRPPKPLDLQA